METQIRTGGNTNAMTGAGFIFGIDYERGFYSFEAIGNLDAPDWVLTGSTSENILKADKYRPETVRYIINNIVSRFSE